MKREHELEKISDYDSSILNANISRLLDEKGLSQVDLANVLGTTPSNVSAILSSDDKNKSRKVDVNKLVKISQLLNVSADELLGMDEIKRPDDEITLADVFQKLFELESLVDFEIKEIEEENHTFAISFNESVISENLKAWSQLKACEIDSDLKDQIIKDWRKRLLSDGVDRPKKQHFRTANEVLQHTMDLYAEKLKNQQEK